MREEKDKNDQKSSLPPAISRQSRKIPQNTKKEDKLRSNKLVKCGVPVNREKEFNVQKVIQPLENLIYERQKRDDEI